jgi:hypothetical protein
MAQQIRAGLMPIGGVGPAALRLGSWPSTSLRSGVFLVFFVIVTPSSLRAVYPARSDAGMFQQLRAATLKSGDRCGRDTLLPHHRSADL